MMNQRDILFDAIGMLKRETVPVLPEGLVDLTLKGINRELSKTAGIKEGRAVLFVLRRVSSVAAVILVVAALAVVTVITVQKKETKLPTTKVVPGDRQAETREQRLEKVKTMFAQGDVEAITQMTLHGDYEMKKAIAWHLARIGGAKAVSLLNQLAVLWDGADQDNPFVEAVEQIAISEGSAPNAMEDSLGADTLLPAEEQGVMYFRVLERDSQLPVSGANLNIKIHGVSGTKYQLTDVNGLGKIYTGENIPKYLSVMVTSPGFVSKSVMYDNYAAAKPIPSEYTLLLERGTSIGGVVKNEQGDPIDGATVLVSLRSNISDRDQIENVCIQDCKVVTDVDGLWECNVIPESAEQVDIQLKHPDYIDDEYAGQTVKDPIETLRQLGSVAIMKKGVMVTGIVTDNQGTAIKGVKFTLGDSRYTKIPVFESDANGFFNFGHCRPGQLIVTAEAKGYAPLLEEVALDGQVEELLLELQPGNTIRGVVVDSDEKPIKGAIVSSESWKGYQTLRYRKNTDTEGRFEWIDAPDGEVLFSIYKPGYLSISKLAMSPDVDDHIIVMYPSVKVSGTVVDAETGQPIENFDLIEGYQWQSSDKVTWQLSSRKRFGQGQYKVEFSQGGVDAFGIRIEAEGYLPADSNLFWFDQENSEYNFQLQKGQSPSGFIYLPDGLAAEGAEVIVCNDRSRPYIKNGVNSQKQECIYAKTGTNGQFVLPAQKDEFSLIVLHNEGYAILTSEQLAQNENIYLKGWGRLEGSLYVGDKPAAGEIVAVYSDKEPRVVNFENKVTTDTGGRFVFYRLCAGDAKVSRVIQTGPHTTGYSNTESVEIISGQTIYVEIGGAGRPIIGSVVMPENYSQPIDWGNADCSISSILDSDALPPYPENIGEMTLKEHLQWMISWQKTEEGAQYAKDNCMPTYPDDLAAMTDEQISEWLKQWQQSEEGKACMETRRQRQQELEKQRKRYRLKINPDGTFRAEDVVSGRYKLSIYLRGKGTESYSNNGEMIGNLNYDFVVPDIGSDYVEEPLYQFQLVRADSIQGNKHKFESSLCRFDIQTQASSTAASKSSIVGYSRLLNFLCLN